MQSSKKISEINQDIEENYQEPHLELIHNLADTLASSSNNASVDPAVQGDVLRDHFLQFVYDGLDGISCSNGLLLIPCNGDLILFQRKHI